MEQATLGMIRGLYFSVHGRPPRGKVSSSKSAMKSSIEQVDPDAWGVIERAASRLEGSDTQRDFDYPSSSLSKWYFNLQDYEGNTALHSAAREGDTELIKYLLDKGCDPSVENDDGDTPLHLVSSTEDLPEACRILIDAGLKGDEMNLTGETAVDSIERRLGKQAGLPSEMQQKVKKVKEIGVLPTRQADELDSQRVILSYLMIFTPFLVALFAVLFLNFLPQPEGGIWYPSEGM